MDNLPGEVLVDSARAIFRASSAGQPKGYAAYITSQMYLLKVQDLRYAKEWIVTALQHDPNNQKYRDLKSSIEREQP